MVGWGLVSNYPLADNREPTRGPSQGWRITNTIIDHNGDTQTTSSCTSPKKIEERCQMRKTLSRMPFCQLTQICTHKPPGKKPRASKRSVRLLTREPGAGQWPVGMPLPKLVPATTCLLITQAGQAGGAPAAVVLQMQLCQGCNGGFFLTKC